MPEPLDYYADPLPDELPPRNPLFFALGILGIIVIMVAIAAVVIVMAGLIGS